MCTEENIKFLPSAYPKPEGLPVLKRAAAFPCKGSWPRSPDALPYTRRFFPQAGCGLAWPSSSSSSPVLAACAPFTRWPLSPVPRHHSHRTRSPAQARTADPRPSFLEALPLRDADPHMAGAKGFTQQPLEETCHLERLVLRSEVIRTCHRQKLGQKWAWHPSKGLSGT